jgi:hypothetical protein
VSQLVEYLEAAKTEEVARRLEADGYAVTRHAPPYDLVATRNGQRIAIEVTALAALGQARQHVRELRERAFNQGFTEFRQVIANPPHETRVEIDGLNDQLFRYFVDHPPASLAALGPHAPITKVTLVEIDAIHVSAGESRVAGTGVVEVELADDRGEARGSTRWEADFPFAFAVTLDHDLIISAVETLEVDTSHFREETTPAPQ